MSNSNFFDHVSREARRTVLVRQPKRLDTARDDLNRAIARRAKLRRTEKAKPAPLTHRWDCGCIGCTYTRTARQQGQLERRRRILTGAS